MTQFPIPEGYVTVPQAAKLLKVKEASVRQYLLTGRLTTHKLGSMTLISLAEIEAKRKSCD